MNRRNFLGSSGAAFLAVTLLPRRGYTFLSDKVFGVDACVPTTSDILGPFYRAGAPLRSDLQVAGHPGTPFIFKGVVSDENCTPIPNATVDVWHADNDGNYDNSTPGYNYRGYQQTNSMGEYEFLSIFPGKYLNGSQFRPVHVHFRVTDPGFTELITQLYFQGDTDIPADPWASDPNAALRIVPVTNATGTDTAEFDITLPGVLGVDELGTDEKVKVIPAGQGRINIKVEGHSINNAEVFDISGRLLSGVYDVENPTVSFQLPSHCAYFVRLDVGGKILVHKFVNP